MSIDRAAVRTTTEDQGHREVQVTVLGDDDTRDDVEHIEPYGFTSRPQDASGQNGPDAVVVDVGETSDHQVVILVGDRRYRLKTLAKGEVAIYDDLGQAVVLTRTGIEVRADAIRAGNGTLGALVRWPALLSFLSTLTLPVTNATPLAPGPVTAGPPASVPDCGTVVITSR